MSVTPPLPNAQSYLLLTLPNATVRQSFDGEQMVLANGELQLEVVSLPIPAEIGHQTANPFAPSGGEETHDLWLVVKVGPEFEHTLVPGNHIVPAAPGGYGATIALTDSGALGPPGPSYTLSDTGIPGAELKLAFPPPSSMTEREDLDTFEILLQQYGVLPEGSALEGLTVPGLVANEKGGYAGAGYPPEKGAAPAYAPPAGGSTSMAATAAAGGAATGAGGVHVAGGDTEALKGHFVLVDPGTGAVLGELDTPVHGASAVAAQSPDKPVVIDFEGVAHQYAGRAVTVTTVSDAELKDSWMLWGAHNLGKGIITLSSLGSSALMYGADQFRRHTVPRPEPMKMGTGSKYLQTAHHASVGAAGVTRKTAGAINNAVARIAGGKKAVRPQKNPGVFGGPAQPASSAPGLPPRPTSPGKQGAPALPPRPGSASPNPPAYGAPSHGAGGAYATEKTGYNSGQTGYSAGQGGYNGAQTSHGGAHASIAPAGGKLSPGATSPSGSAHPNFVQYETIPAGAKKRGFLNKTLLATDMVFSSLEAATNQLVTAGTAAATTVAGHRYGAEAAQATAMAGGTVRNAMLVYVDVRGVGRRGILKASAKGFIKGRLRSGEEVRIQAGEGVSQQDGELVVGVPQLPNGKK